MALRRTTTALGGTLRVTTRSICWHGLFSELPQCCRLLSCKNLGSRWDRSLRPNQTPATTQSSEEKNMGKFFLLILAGALCWLAFPSAMEAQSDAEKIYKANCVLCHSAD